MHTTPLPSDSADNLYALLVTHHRLCTRCTSKQDCPTGAQLLRDWGLAENENPDGWWLPKAERAAIRGEANPYLPAPGERTAND